jgi:hypothetical protein
MPRLPRKAIPVEIKCRVAMRQLGEMWPDQVIEDNRGKLGRLLEQLLEHLRVLVNEPDLRLDHNPALGLRQRFTSRRGTRYVPDEHDPEYLIYRGAHAHHIKTNVRGDGAQYSDTVLMKRERRRQKKARQVKRPTKWVKKSTWPKGRKIRSRGFKK